MDSSVPTQRWEDVEAFLLAEATRDLERYGSEHGLESMRPCVVAYAGDTPLLTAFLRPFPPHGAMTPIIEVLSAAVPLGADRVALSLSGRAWSMHDPLPPVIDGVGDLRQRVVILTFVDDHERRGHRTEVIHPFEVAAGRVVWGERRDLGPSIGEVSQGLELLVRNRDELRATDKQIAVQLRRCSLLGHLVAVGPTVADRIDLDDPLLDDVARRALPACPRPPAARRSPRIARRPTRRRSDRR